jgi:small subunit ribosomal protein S8
MTMTDPIADFLTRIRNAVSIDRERVSVPHSRVKEALCRVLKEEGFVADYRVTEDPHKKLHIFLKYGPNGEKVINKIERVSKPGRRLYSPFDEIPRVLDGMGIMVVSTSKGIMSDRLCREQKIGGEVICRVW